jgi:hypothetical protein
MAQPSSRIRPRFAGALTVAVLACACSSPTKPSEPAGDTEPPGFGSDTGTPGAEAGRFVAAVTGRFLDETGTPPDPGFGVSVCGPVCYLGETSSDGTFSVTVGSALDLPAFSVLPHGRPYVAGFYFALPVDASGRSIDVGDLHLVTMPHDGPSIDRIGGDLQTLESGPARLTIERGRRTTLEFDDVSAGAAGSEFRATRVDAALLGDYVPADAVMVVALGPFESYEVDASGRTVPAQLDFANDAGLPAGTAVELLALGSYLHPEWIPPARFTQVATGHVTMDGERIAVDDGGFLYLTWVAIRPARAELSR